MEQLPKEDRGATNFTPGGSRTKSPSGNSRVGRKWKVEETQEKPKVEVEQLPEEKGNVDREESGDWPISTVIGRDFRC